MDNLNKKEEIEIKEPLQENIPRETREQRIEGREPLVERERSREGEIKETLEEIEGMEPPQALKAAAEKEATGISSSGSDANGKVSQVLKLAEAKGLLYAINVAKSLNDAYLMDVLHAALAKDGFYKKFRK